MILLGAVNVPIPYGKNSTYPDSIFINSILAILQNSTLIGQYNSKAQISSRSIVLRALNSVLYSIRIKNLICTVLT